MSDKLTQAEVDGAFAQWDCPGAHGCDKPRKEKTDRPEIFPCIGCKAPWRTIGPNGAIIYRSYADYVD